MQFSCNWLADYVDLPDDPAELARRLTDAGLAVEGIEEVTLEDGSKDVVLDVDVTTNRPDCMNHLGLAREVATLYRTELRLPEVEIAPAETRARDVARLSVDDFELCPRYVGIVLEGIKIGPSPAWLKARLEAIGQRSISNVVDVTNYVLWETGQPLHAFDLRKLGDPPTIRVRRAHEGEKLTTLDGEERQLDPEVLVIADAEKATALAGIMGGLASEVTETTTDVLLESAHFDPSTVRRGKGKLGMHTDACHRFERGVDPEGCLRAARRAAALMVELGGGRVLDGHVEEAKLRADWPPRVELRQGKLNRFGGAEISAEETEDILVRLGFELEELGAGHWRVTVPPWRYFDFENAYPADLYEEVLRIYGFNNVLSTLPRLSGTDEPESPSHWLRRHVQDVLSASGYVEAIDYAFHDRASFEAYPSLYDEGEALALKNPLSDRYAVMRRSLLPGLVESARYNLRRGAPAVRLFEIGHVFCLQADGHGEQEALGLVAGGRLGTPWERPVDVDFFDLKGALEGLAMELGLNFELRPAEVRKVVAGTAAEVLLAGGETVGYAGQLDDPDLPYPLFVAEIALGPLAGGAASYETQPPSRFPGIAVDTTLTHGLGVSWSELERAVAAIGAEDLTDFRLKDRYRGKGVPEGAVNTTLTFLYNSAERSLTQEEVNERHQRLAAELERRFGWTA